MPRTITAEQLQEAVDTFHAAGSNYSKAALILGIPRPTVQSRIEQALWLTHPKYRITYRMPVQVQQFKDVKIKPWVSIVG